MRIVAVSTDVTHSFALPEFNVNLTLNPGKEKIAEFSVDKEGEFDVHCAVYCGPGHMDMRGKFIVVKEYLLTKGTQGVTIIIE